MTARLVRDPSFGVHRCTACNRQIVFATTEAGKRMPVDVDRTAGGNLLLYTETVLEEALPGYRVRAVTPAERKGLEGNVWISHFATCPDAELFRGAAR